MAFEGGTSGDPETSSSDGNGGEGLPSMERILEEIRQLCFGLCTEVDPLRVVQSIRKGMSAGMSIGEFNDLAAQTCAYMATAHPDYSKLAARIAVHYLHQNTESDFFEVIKTLYMYKDHLGRGCALTSDAIYIFVEEHRAELNLALDYSRDFDYDYFGYKTLERSYLLRVHGKIVERPQHLFMRVACGIHCGDLPRTLETYRLMSQKYFTHASPTLFNSGTSHPQMSSCFLLTMKEDSIDGIFSTLRQCALISKEAGGVGLNVTDVRATNSYIRGTNGYANGLLPMLRIFNDTARYVDQGGGKRRGSMAVYLEPWHFDIFDFLDMRKSHGKEERRARDLFGALWIPDLFMERVQDNGLTDVWGDDFKALYEKYELEGRGRKTIPAQHLWFAILQAQIETGTPYMMYKDACNRKSNQKGLGTMKGGNLCTEVVEFTSKDEVAVCNVASVSLPSFVDPQSKSFNYEELKAVVKVVTRNLNRIIDRNYYPLPEARKSNLRHRPIGIGVQGLADAFMLMRYPFDSMGARVLNKNIFECIYFAALEASCELAAIEGPYETYRGSPASEGILQFDMWNVKPDSGLCDWDALKGKINIHGLRNSLLVSPMPTASTSQILGNNEAFEPFMSNIYYRRVLSGEFPVVNTHLVRDLMERSLWTEEMKQQLIAHNGSVQHLDAVPDDLKALYKTAWEIKQRVLLDLAVDRSPFIDQSQSLNIHMINPTYAKLTSMHFYGWKRGLKTGLYYLRTRPAADAVKVTVDSSLASRAQARQNSATGLISRRTTCQVICEGARLPIRSPSDLAAGTPSDSAKQPSAGDNSSVADVDCKGRTGWVHQSAELPVAEYGADRSFPPEGLARSETDCARRGPPLDGVHGPSAASSDDACHMCSG